MLDYDENMTEQEITQVMAEKLDDEVSFPVQNYSFRKTIFANQWNHVLGDAGDENWR